MNIPFLSTKIDMKGSWLPASHLHWQFKEGQMIVVDSQEGKIYRFNGVGAAIWNGMTQGLTGNEIAVNIVKEFEGAEKKVRADVENFLSELRSGDLIEPSRTSPL